MMKTILGFAEAPMVNTSNRRRRIIIVGWWGRFGLAYFAKKGRESWFFNSVSYSILKNLNQRENWKNADPQVD
jgi:hypothetical protein